MKGFFHPLWKNGPGTVRAVGRTALPGEGKGEDEAEVEGRQVFGLSSLGHVLGLSSLGHVLIAEEQTLLSVPIPLPPSSFDANLHIVIKIAIMFP